MVKEKPKWYNKYGIICRECVRKAREIHGQGDD